MTSPPLTYAQAVNRVQELEAENAHLRFALLRLGRVARRVVGLDRAHGGRLRSHMDALRSTLNEHAIKSVLDAIARGGSRG